MNHVRRILVALTTVPLLLAMAGCGSDGFEEDSGGGGETVTIVGQKFTEADIMTQLYKQLLEKDGFKTDVKNLGARDIYLDPLQKGDVQVSADYLSSMTEALNRKANGDDAEPVASPDVQATLGELKTLAAKYDITPLEPAEAEDANSYAVTKDYAEKNNLTTLSDLGKLGKPVALAAASDCPDRPDCGKGLESVYGIKLSKVEPLGFGTPDTKKALTDGEVELGQVGTTDGSLDADGSRGAGGRQELAERREPRPGGQLRMAQGQPQGRGRVEQALRRAHHRGPHDAQRQGRRRAARGEPGGRGLPQGEGLDLSGVTHRLASGLVADLEELGC